jgi:hypothetical protein
VRGGEGYGGASHGCTQQGYSLPPKQPPGLAAVKHPQRQHALPAEPRRRGNRSGASSRGELYEYYNDIGRLKVFSSLFPEP